MKNKRIEYRISDEFNQFIEGIWRTNYYRQKGIKSKADFIRYSIIKTVESDSKGILQKFKDVPEINTYLKPLKSNDKIKRDIEEYFNQTKT